MSKKAERNHYNFSHSVELTNLLKQFTLELKWHVLKTFPGFILDNWKAQYFYHLLAKNK